MFIYCILLAYQSSTYIAAIWNKPFDLILFELRTYVGVPYWLIKQWLHIGFLLRQSSDNDRYVVTSFFENIDRLVMRYTDQVMPIHLTKQQWRCCGNDMLPLGQKYENMTSSTKPEIHNIL